MQFFGETVAFSGPVEFCQKQYTNLFTGVKRTVASQMNYVRLFANRLLGSAKPGVRHAKSSDQSAAKKTDDGYQGQG